MEAIRYFRDNPAVKERMVAFTAGNGEPAYHFAVPIREESYCLGCHGSREQALQGIKARYDTGFDYNIGDLRGILSIKLPATGLREQIEQHRRDALIQYAGMFVLMFLLLGIAVNRLVVRRVVGLQQASEALQRGEINTLKNMACSDEIGKLSCNFNRMAETVINREQELRDRESLQRAVVESAKDAIVMTDDTGKIMLFNPVACRLFGYDQSEVIG